MIAELCFEEEVGVLLVSLCGSEIHGEVQMNPLLMQSLEAASETPRFNVRLGAELVVEPSAYKDWHFFSQFLC